MMTIAVFGRSTFVIISNATRDFGIRPRVGGGRSPVWRARAVRMLVVIMAVFAIGGVFCSSCCLDPSLEDASSSPKLVLLRPRRPRSLSTALPLTVMTMVTIAIVARTSVARAAAPPRWLLTTTTTPPLLPPLPLFAVFLRVAGCRLLPLLPLSPVTKLPPRLMLALI